MNQEVFEHAAEQTEERTVEELEHDIRRHKRRIWKWSIICICCVIAITLGLYFYFKYQTYDRAYVTKSYKSKNVDNSNYVEFVDNILKYSKDGALLLDKKGEELWNQPYQMQNPIVETCKDTVLVGDEGGTSMFVLQKNGTKGEIHTARPIEKMTVSEQGIVAAVLKDEDTPRIVCYDAQGSVLVEQKASLVRTGYPIDLALSNDGKTLLVSYLYIKGSSVTTRIVYYNFGKAGEGKKDHQLVQTDYENTIMPSVLFINNHTSLIVGDDKLLFYEGKEEPKLSKTIPVEKEIKGIAYEDNCLALILKNSGKTDSELRLYDMNGKQTMSVNLGGEYNNIKLTKNQIILFDGNRCSIFNKAGIHKYEGKLETNIMEIIPFTGINKYLVISANELQEVQLAK